MDAKIGLLLLTVMFVGLHADAPPAVVSTFKCSRDKPACSGSGTCNIQTNECVCDSNVDGYDCSVPFTATSTSCLPGCASSGKCYNTGSIGTPVHRCICNPGFTGTDCNDPVSSVACDGTNFELTWIAPAGFTGTVFPGPDKATTCITKSANVYTLALATTANCGVTATTSGTTTVYKAEVVFKFFALILSPTDDVAQLECTFDSSQNAVTDTALTTVSYNINAFTQNTLVASNTITLLGSTFLKTIGIGNSYQAVTPGTTAGIGDYFKLKVTLPSSTIFTKILLLNCKTDDGAATPANIVNLLTNSCPSPGQGLQILYDIVRISNTEIDLIIKAYQATSGSKMIKMYCDVKICLASYSSNCDDITCTQSYGGLTNPGAGRKKRSVDVISNNTIGTITAWLPVVGPFGIQGTQQFAAEECSLSREFIIIIVILCLLILLLAVVTVFFALKRISKRRSKVDDMQTVYSNKQ